MNKNEYYSLRTIRNVRGWLKRRARKALKRFNVNCRCTVILKDDNGVNIIKSRRCKGRILKTYKE